jgi:hypothetical protein
VAVSVHTQSAPSVRPFFDEAFDELVPFPEGRSFIVGGNFNLSRNYKNDCPLFAQYMSGRAVAASVAGRDDAGGFRAPLPPPSRPPARRAGSGVRPATSS